MLYSGSENFLETTTLGRKEEIMDKLVRRVTVVQRSGDTRERTVVYEDPDERHDEENRRKTSPWLRPVEHIARHLLKAQLVGYQDAYQRYLNSARRRRNGWLYDAPSNYMKASRN